MSNEKATKVPKRKLKVKKITRYEIDDTDCGGDYSEVLIEIRGEVVATYGDHYHDKGQEKAEGFIDALKHIYGENLVVVEHEDRNDYE
jgi:hypothetical protein